MDLQWIPVWNYLNLIYKFMELLNKTKNNEIMLGAELLQETTSVN